MPRRLPRDVSGDELIAKLANYNYVLARQTSSHVRLTRNSVDGDQHITVPRHKALRMGTLNGILNDVANQLGKKKRVIVDEMFE